MHRYLITGAAGEVRHTLATSIDLPGCALIKVACHFIVARSRPSSKEGQVASHKIDLKPRLQCHRVALVNRNCASFTAGTLVAPPKPERKVRAFEPIASADFNASTYDCVKRSDFAAYAISPSRITN